MDYTAGQILVSREYMATPPGANRIAYRQQPCSFESLTPRGVARIGAENLAASDKRFEAERDYGTVRQSMTDAP